jgi:hypothetical protein
MNIIIMFLIYLIAIFVHELGHIIVSWYISKNIPTIRVNWNIKIIPRTLYSDKEKSFFLGIAIISGMFVFVPFFFWYPVESTYSMIAYLISCGMDFYSLILIEVERIKNEKKS